MPKAKSQKRMMEYDRVGQQSGGSSIVRRNRAPRTIGTATGIRVQNQEVQYNISVGSAANVLLAFNPYGFSWLGPVSWNYAFYKIHKLQWTFVTSSSTNVAGQIQAGVFYERGEAKRWIATPNADSLSQCQQYIRSPIWGGLGVQGTDGGFTQNGCTIQVDTKAAHMRTRNFIVSSVGQTSDLDAEYNQAVGAYLPFSWNSSAASGVVGTWFCAYDVEFFHPTTSTFNLLMNTNLVTEIVKCKNNVELPPGSKCAPVTGSAEVVEESQTSENHVTEECAGAANP